MPCAPNSRRRCGPHLGVIEVGPEAVRTDHEAVAPVRSRASPVEPRIFLAPSDVTRTLRLGCVNTPQAQGGQSRSGARHGNDRRCGRSAPVAEAIGRLSAVRPGCLSGLQQQHYGRAVRVLLVHETRRLDHEMRLEHAVSSRDPRHFHHRRKALKAGLRRMHHLFRRPAPARCGRPFRRATTASATRAGGQSGRIARRSCCSCDLPGAARRASTVMGIASPTARRLAPDGRQPPVTKLAVPTAAGLSGAKQRRRFDPVPGRQNASARRWVRQPMLAVAMNSGEPAISAARLVVAQALRDNSGWEQLVGAGEPQYRCPSATGTRSCRRPPAALR